MKILKDLFVTAFVMSLMFYLAGSFVAMDFNPSHWEIGHRAVSAFIILAFTALITAARNS